MSAYTCGWSGRNGAPKHAENVSLGSVTPRSVPATLAVYPERKWYMAWAGVSRASGGITPNASQVRNTMCAGCPDEPPGTWLGTKWIRYDARVFSVIAAESR